MAYLTANIGINHNGSLDTAFDLIYEAKEAGFDAVKFQKRTPRKTIPSPKWDVERDTPWGRMGYIEYREKIEFGKEHFDEINNYCKECEIDWFASVWDEESLEFIMQYRVPFIKIPSVKITRMELLRAALKATEDHFYTEVMVSAGMSTVNEVDRAVEALNHSCVIMHCAPTFPSKVEHLNLHMVPFLKERYELPVGYSGYEIGLATTVAAVAMGAEYVERSVTLDRAMWGTHQAASIEPDSMKQLVRDIRSFETALGTQGGTRPLSEHELVPVNQGGK